jgi:glycerol uptake facilitator-like aquaporin
MTVEIGRRLLAEFIGAARLLIFGAGALVEVGLVGSDPSVRPSRTRAMQGAGSQLSTMQEMEVDRP